MKICGNRHPLSSSSAECDQKLRTHVDSDKVNLGVTVLARLGGGHFDDLARAVLDDDEAVLPQSRALHWVGEGGTGIGALEGVLML